MNNPITTTDTKAVADKDNLLLAIAIQAAFMELLTKNQEYILEMIEDHKKYSAIFKNIGTAKEVGTRFLKELQKHQKAYEQKYPSDALPDIQDLHKAIANPIATAIKYALQHPTNPQEETNRLFAILWAYTNGEITETYEHESSNCL